MRYLVILSLLVLSACHSGWNKDPFEGEDERIQNAVEPETKVKKLPPPKRNTLYPVVSAVWPVNEGETLEIPVDWTIGHADVAFERLEVIDLNKHFPEARWDSENKKIVITPDINTVPVAEAYVVQPLTLAFFSKYEDQEFRTETTIHVHVLPQNSLPPIIDEEELQTWDVISGKSKIVKVYVEDSSSEYSPKLRAIDIIPSSWGAGPIGAQFIRDNSEGVYDDTKKRWEFDVKIDVPEFAYIPSGGKVMTVDLFAYSIHGVPSRAVKFRFRLYASATRPNIVAERTIYAKVGETLDYTFSVYDPFERGDVIAQCATTQKPDGLRCTCRQESTITSRSQSFCTMTWTPTTVGTFNVNATGKNRVRQPGTNNFETAERNTTLRVQVSQ